MKLVWCPDTASKAYIEAVQLLADRNLKDANVAELIAAMAGGWKAQMIVEAGTPGDSPATSIALAAAAKHTGGQRIAVISYRDSKAEYKDSKDVIGEVEGVDFMVVDMGRKDAGRVMREAKVGPRGMVVVCKNAEKTEGGLILREGMRVVRKVYLPLGQGIEILHVGVGKGPRFDDGSGCRRWFKYVDRVTGEEHLFKK